MSTQPAEQAATSLAVREQVALGSQGIQLTTFDELYRFAKVVACTDFAPKEYRGKPESCMIAIQCGLEVGFSPMAALATISVVNGKASIHTDGPLALVRRSGLLADFSEGLVVRTSTGFACSCSKFARTSDCIHVHAAQVKFANKDEQKVAVCLAHRKGYADPRIGTYSYLDAVTAKLWGKRGRDGQSTPWITDPDRMLGFRCRGFVLRDEFGDVLKGMISFEEAQDYPDDTPSPPNGNGEPAAPTSRVDVLKSRLANAASTPDPDPDPEPDAIDAVEESPDPPAAVETKPADPEKKRTSRSKTVDTPQPAKPDADAKISKVGAKQLQEAMDDWDSQAVREFLMEFDLDRLEDIAMLPASLYREAMAFVDDRNTKPGDADAAPIAEAGPTHFTEEHIAALGAKAKAAGIQDEWFEGGLASMLGVRTLAEAPIADLARAEQCIEIKGYALKTGADLQIALTHYDVGQYSQLTDKQLDVVLAKLKERHEQSDPFAGQ